MAVVAYIEDPAVPVDQQISSAEPEHAKDVSAGESKSQQFKNRNFNVPADEDQHANAGGDDEVRPSIFSSYGIHGESTIESRF